MRLCLSLILLCLTYTLTACTEGSESPVIIRNPADSTPKPNINQNSETKTDTPNPSPAATIRVKVFFPREPESAQDFSYVEPVWRTTTNLGVAKFALEQLITGPTNQEKTLGLVSVINLKGRSNCGQDFQININNTVAQVKFCRSIVSAGIGDNARVKSAIEATLKQFPSIKSVVILNRDGNCFGDLSGENLCLSGNNQ